jgi:hypothetical protein
MMSAAKVPECYCKNLWGESFQSTTCLDGLTVVKLEDKKLTRFEHWEGQLSRFVNNLRKWGEIGIVKSNTKPHPKL